MTQATINSNTYSDDGTSARDMLHGGHRTWFLPMVGDVVTVAGVVAGQAAQTAIDAVNAANGAAATKGTSTTSLTVSAGTKTLTTQAGKQFAAGNYVTISRPSAPATMMHGVVTSYSGTSLVVSAATSAGSGTYTDWTIALSGPQGATGASGDGSISYLAKTGAYTITAADKAKIIDCSGTFNLSFQACETLGPTWSTYIRNSGAGIITLDPYASQTIDGDTTFALNPGSSVMVSCDGSTLRKIGLYTYARQYLHVRDEKASGANGGSSSTGLNVRTLNTVVANTIPGASLASNIVTLPPGMYDFVASASVYGSNTNKISRLALYNNTDSSDLMVGQSAQSGSSIVDLRTNTVRGRIALSAPSGVKLNHYISAGYATTGLGFPASTGQPEIYADLQIRKVA